MTIEPSDTPIDIPMPEVIIGQVPHVVRTDGWTCVQPSCDGIHHFYVYG
jgi:hypothetical protein